MFLLKFSIKLTVSGPDRGPLIYTGLYQKPSIQNEQANPLSRQTFDWKHDNGKYSLYCLFSILFNINCITRYRLVSFIVILTMNLFCRKWPPRLRQRQRLNTARRMKLRSK